MKKESAILAIGVAFAIGFIAGSTVVVLKNKDGTEKSIITSNTQFPISKEPISIELMEKIEDLKEMVRENPKDLAAWVKLGNIYAEHHQYREAAEAYSHSLSIKPNDPDIRTNFGLMLRGLGDYGGAIEEFKKAAQYDPKHVSSRYYLGLILLQNKGNNQETIKAWEDYLQVEPKGQRANQVRVEIERLKAGTAGNKRNKTD